MNELVRNGPGEGYERPTLDDRTDSFSVLEGELELALGEETFRAGPGTFTAVPPGGFEHDMRRAGA